MERPIRYIYSKDKFRVFVSSSTYDSVSGMYAADCDGNVICVEAVLVEPGQSHEESKYFMGFPVPVSVDKNGYSVIITRINRFNLSLPVHRIVAFGWVPGFFPGAVVNHISGLKSDNRAINLEWCTPGQNSSHAHRIGLVPNTQYILDKNTGVFYYSAQDYMDIHGISEYDQFKLYLKKNKRNLDYAR
jgi:hypothetical protein